MFKKNFILVINFLQVFSLNAEKPSNDYTRCRTISQHALITMGRLSSITNKTRDDISGLDQNQSSSSSANSSLKSSADTSSRGFGTNLNFNFSSGSRADTSSSDSSSANSNQDPGVSLGLGANSNQDPSVSLSSSANSNQDSSVSLSSSANSNQDQSVSLSSSPNFSSSENSSSSVNQSSILNSSVSESLDPIASFGSTVVASINPETQQVSQFLELNNNQELSNTELSNTAVAPGLSKNQKVLKEYAEKVVSFFYDKNSISTLFIHLQGWSNRDACQKTQAVLNANYKGVKVTRVLGGLLTLWCAKKLWGKFRGNNTSNNP